MRIEEKKGVCHKKALLPMCKRAFKIMADYSFVLQLRMQATLTAFFNLGWIKVIKLIWQIMLKQIIV